MNGYDAVKTIREIEKDNPKHLKTIIIAQTASSFEEEHATILEAGCDDFLRKPFKEAEVFDLLSNHLGIRFVYEEENRIKDRETRITGEEAPALEALASLPASLLENLKLGAHRADFLLLSGLIEQIREHDERLAGGLRRLVEDFEYDGILALIREKAAS
jgi:CheY-like chemotaxis protein